MVKSGRPTMTQSFNDGAFDSQQQPMLKSGNRKPSQSARVVTTDASNNDLELGRSTDELEVNDLDESERKRSSFR